MRKFIRNVVLCLLGVVLGGSLAWAADAPTLRPDHPTRYTVQKGDTLWGISGRFLSEPWRWPDLWQANPQIKNPDLIFPGDELELVYVEGRPRLHKRSGRSSGVVKLSPRMRVTEAPVPTVPMDAIGPFLTRPVVLPSEDDFDDAPYVLDFPDEHIRVGAGDVFYARNIGHPVGTRFDIVRKAGELRSGDSDELLGYGAMFVGTATLVAPGDPATLQVEAARFDVRKGDRLVTAEEEAVYQDFQPRAPASPVYGSIIAISGYSGGSPVMQGGRYDIVVLDRGQQDGLVAGDVVRIDRQGRIVRDQVRWFEGRPNEIVSSSTWDGLPQPRDETMQYLRPSADPMTEYREAPVSGLGPGEPVKLPDERAGLAMVFRTFDRVSVALVMESTKAIHTGDRIRNP
jgi:LysM domain